MTDARTLGQIVDDLGTNLELSEGDLVADVLVIGKVIDANGQVSAIICGSESLSWIDQLGLLEAARRIIDAHEIRHRDEDDDL